jgi:tektin-3
MFFFLVDLFLGISKMDYMGSTSTAQYSRMSRRPQQSRQLPSIGALDSRLSSAPPYSGLLTRSVSLSWRPSTFYRSARIEPTQSFSLSTAKPFSSTNYLNNIDSVKVPPIFPSAREALYTRYTPKDWYNAQMTNYLASDKIRAAAERLRSDTIRLAREKDEQTFKNNVESSKRLGERINEIEYWKGELEKVKNKVKRKIEDVEFKRREIERQLSESEKPLRIAQENLYEREKRQGLFN